MTEWPNDWFRGGDGTPDAGGAGAAGGGDKTVNIPPASHPGGQYQVRQYQGGQAAAGQSAAAAPGQWPEQPPVNSSGRGSGTAGPTSPVYAPRRTWGPGGPGGPRWRRWLRPRRIAGVLAVVIALLLVATVGTYFYLNSKLHRSNILVNYSGRPSAGSGTNWLIAGSDSRQGLTKKQEREYATGGLGISGGRSDTIMILHIPAGGGRPVLISIPRDSYVNIPGYGMNKINAAFDFGGPALLAKTVQSDTGLYINHFMDIGFGGFVRVVDDVGGVRMCFRRALNDRASGVHLHKGCQVLSGGEALAYVRDRHSFATQDLQREQDQRVFLSALLKKMTSAGVMFNPFKALPAASGAVATLTVDEGTSLYDLYGVAKAMRDPLTTTVPVSNANLLTSNAGDAVQWNQAQASQLFRDLQNGTPLPKYLITGSRKAG
jgi:LCP family protein required for cell wall assembly